MGTGPLIFDDPQYPDNFGLSRAAGRISEYAFDQPHNRLFASVANGGVWMSTDRGQTWASIGDTLPTQIVGALAYAPTGGDGTLIALTGDNAFGGNTYGGMGIFTSTDLGRTWVKAAGAPDGAQGFRLAVKPGDPQTVYAATGFGLFRSTDAGRDWADVVLPTGACAGKSTTRQGCFLANVVTDVQANETGAVVAAVGWRAGNRPNPDGSIQAPSNGIYTSATGAPGDFARTGAGATPAPSNDGFLAGPDVGRVSLGAAYGPDQDHGVVYALVQNSRLFNTNKVEGLDTPGADPLGLGVDPTVTPTYVEGVFVSRDFGRTWRQIVTRQQILSATNSSLAQLQALGFGPGIQAWYNSWVRPDPYTQVGGIPTRLDFGLEEVFETNTSGGATPQVTPAPGVTATGPYSAFGGGCILTLTGGACGTGASTTGLTTLHPDQHAALFVPKDGGSTLFAGNDGGAYAQETPTAGLMTPAGFGKGTDAGFNTLLPYGLGVAKDGTIFAGLQDNGTEKIDPATGKQFETYGGDGTFALVDPDDSKQALAATPSGGLVVSHTGGVKPGPGDDAYTSVAPSALTGAQFLTPFVFDDTSTGRIGLAGRNVFIANSKLADLTSDSWGTPVFDLGTAKHPADADADPTATAGDTPNVATAMALRDNVGYVGFCGSCDPVKENLRFKNGIATNTGGTWHIAAATGLPQRIINNVQVDPGDTRTIYVALGESTARPYAPPHALGDDGVDAVSGHVYKSTDGGESFRDISGNLPNIGATWLLVKGGQLIAATTVGVFASKDKDGGEWGTLGGNLPAAPVFSMAIDPANPNRLVVASYGRGIYRYEFADQPGGAGGSDPGAAGGAGAGTPGTGTTPGSGTTTAPSTTPGAVCRDTIAPLSSYRKRITSARYGRRLVITGRASDRGCGKKGAGKVRRVVISVGRINAKRCRFLQADGKLARRSLPCARTRYIAVRGTTSWRFTSRRSLPKGRYQVWVRAIDTAGNVERKRYARNGLKLRALKR